MNEEVNIKAIDFSVLQVGERFFPSRMLAQDDKGYCIKTETSKTSSGGWTNAKNAVGSPSFIKYDSRVWVRK
jgi:hypothetical protein